jgi:hypothetical protein
VTLHPLVLRAARLLAESRNISTASVRDIAPKIELTLQGILQAEPTPIISPRQQITPIMKMNEKIELIDGNPLYFGRFLGTACVLITVEGREKIDSLPLQETQTRTVPQA